MTTASTAAALVELVPFADSAMDGEASGAAAPVSSGIDTVAASAVAALSLMRSAVDSAERVRASPCVPASGACVIVGAATVAFVRGADVSPSVEAATGGKEALG